MMVSLSVSILWLLAMLAAAVHLQDGGRSVANAARAAAAFVIVVPVAYWLVPQPNWVAVLLALGAFWRLIAGPLPRAGAMLAGASAGLAAALHVAGGVSPWLALPVSAAGLACGLLWRGGVGRADMRGEPVLVAVTLAILPVGLANDIVYGWRSATMLARDGLAVAAPSPPVWVLAVIGLALCAGLLRGIWIGR